MENCKIGGLMGDLCKSLPDGKCGFWSYFFEHEDINKLIEQGRLSDALGTAEDHRDAANSSLYRQCLRISEAKTEANKRLRMVQSAIRKQKKGKS